MNPTFAALLRVSQGLAGIPSEPARGPVAPSNLATVREPTPTPYGPPQPILTLPTCLDVHSEGPGDLLPNVCARDRGHEMPHCTKGYWHTVGHVTTTTWDDEGTR